ncbi:hypothetical protein BT67DRAFT_454319 [Trichocladium antarcticum]|uniref:Uncharacterized protein n=1 Tax=Trichocladium antarcticum TaxID=1450529 RepID=A0AAN6UNU2_9PEZI|nr:hypothetical protein BT67DRAFT_454319 [Trichocladium antarcticum]
MSQAAAAGQAPKRFARRRLELLRMKYYIQYQAKGMALESFVAKRIRDGFRKHAQFQGFSSEVAIQPIIQSPAFPAPVFKGGYHLRIGDLFNGDKYRIRAFPVAEDEEDEQKSDADAKKPRAVRQMSNADAKRSNADAKKQKKSRKIHSYYDWSLILRLVTILLSR